MRSKSLSRVALYEIVWKKPMIHLAKEYRCAPAELRNI